ncbi:hypothetical protein EYF80_022542 [Liparis tanakae]|uniref:Uncharacterized protein n=1 Tax=Liparis tanakae TaxID=230148 RepID=A0A4Z2HQE8_9TELE|nr:hypothetical protein EYF80_022542 [Liparis tanakae]
MHQPHCPERDPDSHEVHEVLRPGNPGRPGGPGLLYPWGPIGPVEGKAEIRSKPDDTRVPCPTGTARLSPGATESRKTPESLVPSWTGRTRRSRPALTREVIRSSKAHMMLQSLWWWVFVCGDGMGWGGGMTISSRWASQRKQMWARTRRDPEKSHRRFSH